MDARVAQSRRRIYGERLWAQDEWNDRYIVPRFNVSPQAQILGVREMRFGDRRLDPYQWGLVPKWARDPGIGSATFVAPAEHVATKPVFRSAFRRRRLLIPVDGFYEWHPKGRKSGQPYYFTRSDDDVMVLAALWEDWQGDRQRGDTREIRSATVVTTVAGPDMEAIHGREPVVLEPAQWGRWLDPRLDDVDELLAMLGSGPAGRLRRWPVAREVGDVRHDSPELVQPIEVSP